MNYAEAKAYCDSVEAMRRTLPQRRSATAEKVSGALTVYLGPRMALDASLPDLTEITSGLDRSNFRSRHRQVADAVRRAVRGRLARDADVDDIDRLLEHLCDVDEEEGEDRRHHIGAEDRVARRRRAEDTIRRRLGRDGMSNADVEALLEELRLQGEDDDEPVDVPGMDPTTYGTEGPMSDDHSRVGRDRRSPARDFFDRHVRTARDVPPAFEGRPTPGGSMVREGEDRLRPRRRHAHDGARGNSFSDRFAFTRGTTPEADSRVPGIKVGSF